MLTCRISARRFVARCAAVSQPGYTAWYEIADKEHSVAQVQLLNVTAVLSSFALRCCGAAALQGASCQLALCLM